MSNGLSLITKFSSKENSNFINEHNLGKEVLIVNEIGKKNKII